MVYFGDVQRGLTTGLPFSQKREEADATGQGLRGWTVPLCLSISKSHTVAVPKTQRGPEDWRWGDGHDPFSAVGRESLIWGLGSCVNS